jgi:hypothetical protein
MASWPPRRSSSIIFENDTSGQNPLPFSTDSTGPEIPANVSTEFAQQTLEATISSARRLSIDSDKFASYPFPLDAVRRFEEAFNHLQNTVPKDFRPFDIPEPIGLKHLDRFDNPEDTAARLEVAVDMYIQRQPELRMTARRQQIVREFVKNWFLASYPFVIEV